MKIIERIQKRQQEGRPFFSFEYFSPKTTQGMINLNDRIERMCHMDPEFIDITWGAGGSRPAATLEVVSNAQKCLGVETCMHLICTDNSIETINKALKEARACGNQNILALRGDPSHGQKHWSPHPEGLSTATDLVRHIRATHGDYFGIGVAAYPELHPESPTLAHDLYYLKQKIDAGADFIVTQLFFDVPKFLEWVQEVRKAGILCPIVPGVMPIQTYAGFKKNVVDAGLSVPRWILEGLEAVKEDEQAIKAFGVEVGVQMTKELVESGLVAGVHYYTFNLERSTRLILEGAGLVPSSSSSSTSSPSSSQQQSFIGSSVASTSTTLPAPTPQTLSVIRKDKPWRSNFLPHRRNHEHQRPIFWANRPKSYISRTETWQKFPVDGSQWRSSTALAKFKSLEEEGYGVSLKYSTAAEARHHWNGQPKELKNLNETFQKYWRGEVQTLPWCDHPCSAGAGGSAEYKERLVEVNGVGCYLAINSQPVVNGARSDDKVFGWGTPGGYVYQKAFLEFFVSPEQLPIIIDRLKTYFPHYSYNAINRSGTSFFYSSCGKSKTNSNLKRRHSSTTDGDYEQKEEEAEEQAEEQLPSTITWGVFPGEEIVQPTIVERCSFMAWKDEAFALWDQWAQCFEGNEKEDVRTKKLLSEIGEGWFLMNVANNDYHEPQGVFELFEEDFARARAKDETETIAQVEVDVVVLEKQSEEKRILLEEVVAVTRSDDDRADVFSSAVALAAAVAAAAVRSSNVRQALSVNSVAVAAEANCSA